LQTHVYNRGGSGVDDDARTAYIYAYWHEGRAGLTWPPAGQEDRYRIDHDNTGHEYGVSAPEANRKFEISGGSDAYVDWWWDAPLTATFDPLPNGGATDHICVGFVINPDTPEEVNPSGIDMQDDLRDPLETNNVAQINLQTEFLTSGSGAERATNASQAEGGAIFNLPMCNITNQNTLLKPHVDTSMLSAGWTVMIDPPDSQLVLRDSSVMVEVTLIPPVDVSHGDSCYTQFWSLDITDSSVVGGVALRARVDDYAPPTFALDWLCTPEDPDCCPDWLGLSCQELDVKVPLEWDLPTVDQLGWPERPWFFIVCRDTNPDLDLLDQVDTCAADYDLSTPRVQWVDYQPDTCGTYYYRVYCVDQAGHVSPGSNEVEVSLPCSCCILRGDVNHSGSRDVSDLTYYVSYMFAGGPEAPCPEEADIDNNGTQDISDLTYYVAYMFGGGPEPPPCD